MKNTTPPEIQMIRRAFLPEILVESDVATLLLPGTSALAIRESILRGELGPFSEVAGRIVLRRESVLAALRAADRRDRGA